MIALYRYQAYRLNRYHHSAVIGTVGIAANGTMIQFSKIIYKNSYFFFFCLMDSPLNSILFALETKRSIIASAKVGSLI